MKTIDCLFIGHNEMSFAEYEEIIRRMGTESGAYRDLKLNFLQYKGKLLTAPEIFNQFYQDTDRYQNDPFHLGDIFSPAIAYLGSFVDRHGFTFDYVNSFQSQKAELIEKLKNNQILSIAITTTLYVSNYPIMEIVSLIREYNSTAKIIIGGPYVATQVKTMDEPSLQYLLKGIDGDIYVNSSQGEATLVKILQALKEDQPLHQIPNIYYRERDQYRKTPIQLENNRLEENMVQWNLFEEDLDTFAELRTSISCPFSCSFCGFPQHAGKYQMVSVEAIEKELDAIESMGTVRSINFIDDTFNVPADRFKEILRMMIRNNYSFKWNSHFRCQFADRETVKLMKESGCEGVFLGIESGNQEILQNMNKAATLEAYQNGLALLNEYEIISYASFIIGFPGETEKAVQDTIRFIEESRPTFFRTQLWYCDPFTPIWEKKDQFQIKGSQFEWEHATMNSKQACDWIEKIFLSIENSTWIPQTNFEFEGIFHLMHRGMNLEQVQRFLEAFNLGIKEKLCNPGQKEISYKVVDLLQSAFIDENELQARLNLGTEKKVELDDAGFDF